MCVTIEVAETEQLPTATCRRRRRRPGRRAKAYGASALFAAVVTAPGRALAQLDDQAPSNVGLPGGVLVAQILGWGKWLGLVACALAIIYGGATWRGMSGNSGRGVEGKAYVGAGAIGALAIGLAVVAVNTLYSAGSAGG